MIKFPSIEQFRSVVRAVRANHDYKGNDDDGKAIYSHTEPYPTLLFNGTIKLHGTNAGIVLYKDGQLKYQSRERELSLKSDNSGFCTYMNGVDLKSLFDGIGFNDHIAIYGEWCGGNIQKGVALNGLPKMFVIFGVKIDGEWLSDYGRDIKDKNIYCIENFKTFEIEIDFNNPELVQNKLIEWTTDVENECPVGKEFGVSGIGEGIVFKSVDNPNYIFKSKGEKHSSSNVKVLNSVDTEQLESYKEFVDYACSENRLKQGLENITAIENIHTGQFIKWVANDILKEESDTLISNNIEWKKVAGMIARKSSEFFKKQL